LLRFQVLGVVTAYGPDGPVGLGPARQRTVLAALLAEPGVIVAFEQLMDRVWGEQPPQRARATLHTYLSRLRALLGSAGGPVLERPSHGYLLRVDAAAVDLHRFRALVSEARRAGDDRAEVLWREALVLWQGAPFADLDSDWLRALASRLEDERTMATLDRNDVLLRRGEHVRLLPELSAASAEHPVDERLAGQLMLALYRCGRQADALAHYRRLRERLVEEMGSDPGPALRELQHRILRHDPELSGAVLAESTRPSAAQSGPVVLSRPRRNCPWTWSASRVAPRTCDASTRCRRPPPATRPPRRRL
jgi:DNA-binding SARP family transcriptional activator